MLTARGAKLALIALVLAFAVVPAYGQYIAGVRVVENSFDGTNLDIDFFEYYTASWPAFSTAFIGGSDATEGMYFPAIDWGDGSVEPPVLTGVNVGSGLALSASSTTVGGVPVHIFRGNYTHTFASPPTNPVTVFSRVFITGGGYNVVPSNATALVNGNVFTFAGNTNTFNVATDALPFAGPPTVEIPTASEAGLLALALLLAGAAFVMFRRS